ncbi:MAG: hypothetical protein LBJ20_08030 [Candidatus Methanoplasma sp.]|nr:hypothetical protein [Candidatus Methanoplasma sp.]
MELSDEEMEYNGGFARIQAQLYRLYALTASVTVTVAGNTGLMDKDAAEKISTAATAVGVVTGYASGIGALRTSTATAAASTLVRATSSVSSEPGLNMAASQL